MLLRVRRSSFLMQENGVLISKCETFLVATKTTTETTGFAYKSNNYAKFYSTNDHWSKIPQFLSFLTPDCAFLLHYCNEVFTKVTFCRTSRCFYLVPVASSHKISTMKFPCSSALRLKRSSGVTLSWLVYLRPNLFLNLELWNKDPLST